MKKTLFAAIVGYTGEVTRDDRILMAPEDGKMVSRPYPLPVRAEIQGVFTLIGAVEMAALCDRRILLFGRIFPEYADAPIVRGLRNGGLRFELDVDDVNALYSPEDKGIARFQRWRLAAVTVGGRPAWNLPPVVIEDLNLKETASA